MLDDTLASVQNELKRVAAIVDHRLSRSIQELVFVDGNIYGGNIIFECWRGMGWPGSRTEMLDLFPHVPKNSVVHVIDMTYGKLRECQLSDDPISDDGRQRWQAIDGPEEHTYPCMTREAMLLKQEKCYELVGDSKTSSKEFVYINGDIYSGKVIFGRYKGCGWMSGRTHDIELGHDAPRDNASVYLMDIGFGKLRRCYPAARRPPFDKENTWQALDDPETVLAEAERRRLRG